eukprot:3497127-Pyramimonas_sp.AAC.1
MTQRRLQGRLTNPEDDSGGYFQTSRKDFHAGSFRRSNFLWTPPAQEPRHPPLSASLTYPALLIINTIDHLHHLSSTPIIVTT